MAAMQIFVKAMTGKTDVCAHGVRCKQIMTMTLVMQASDIVISAKARIQALTGISPNQQLLIFEEQSLQNHRTLSECHIQNESTLHMDRVWPEIGILISNGVGPSFTVTLIPPDPIAMLKDMIKLETGIYPDQQLLMFGDSELQDNLSTLADENIQDGSIVFLFLRMHLDRSW